MSDGATVATIEPGQRGFVFCDGSDWYDFGVVETSAPGEAVQKASGTIATGDVATLNATPVEMIPAPGAGKYIEVLSVHWFLDFATTAYDAAAAGDTLEAKYTNGSGDAVVDAVAGDAIGAAAADYHTIVQAVQELIPVANAAVVAHVNTGEWYGAAGDSPLKWEALYRVRDLAF